MDIAAEHFHTVVVDMVVVGIAAPFGTAADKVVDKAADTAADNQNNCSGFHKNFRP